MTSGVVFPVSDDAGNRSTSALGRAVVAAALREVDPVGSRAAEQETVWRSHYIAHFRRQIEAGLPSGRRLGGVRTTGCGNCTTGCG